MGPMEAAGDTENITLDEEETLTVDAAIELPMLLLLLVLTEHWWIASPPVQLYKDCHSASLNNIQIELPLLTATDAM